MNKDFKCDIDYRKLRRGDDVEVSTDPTMSEHQVLLGRVTEVKSNGVDIIMTMDDGQEMFLWDCWHASDTRIEERPDVFGDGTKGVFRLTATQQILKDIQENQGGLVELARLPETIARMEQRIDELREQFEDFASKGKKPPAKAKSRARKDLEEAFADEQPVGA